MLNISNVTKLINGEPLFENASVQIYKGEKVGLVGPNGSGKSTLFRLIMKEDQPDMGAISIPDTCRIAYFSQSVGEMQGRSALDEVILGDAKIAILKKQLKEFQDMMADYEKYSDNEMNDILMKMGDVQTEFEKRGGYDLETRAEEVLTGLGILPEQHQQQVEDFSGGWKMRIALAKVLVVNPDIILMDEPTNYLDLETILWLEDWLKDFEGAVFMTTHDRGFMNAIVKKIVDISNMELTTYSGNFNFYEKEKILRRSQLQSEFDRQQENLSKEEAFIAKFKARASHAAQVQSRIKKLEKIERIKLPAKEDVMDFEFTVPPRGGDDVVVIKELTKSFTKSNGKKLIVFENLTTTIKRLDKIAIVGVNGAGKSTFLKIICQQLKATSGIATLGPSIKLGYFSQYSLEVLRPEVSAMDEVRLVLTGATDGFLRNLLAVFLFKGDDVHKKVKHLSGGEKSRLVLAVLLSQNNNLLVLDEPTNHLDLASRVVLLNALKKYQGTILFVSHDRHFLQELTAKVYEVDTGSIQIYPGDYNFYLDKKSS
jgi:ATP-binding cassette, subfamily F, member 3